MTTPHTQPCTHCGQPAYVRDDSPSERAFCCVGCEAVWHALHDAGFEEFYAWREASGSAGVTPAKESAQRGAGFLDGLERKAAVQTDGTKKLTLMLDGVHCAGCVWLIERMPRSVSGVRDARLDVSRGTLALRWDPEAVELRTVAQWLRGFGYTIQGSGENVHGREDRDLLVRMGVCWAVAGNVMLIAFAFYSGLSPQSEGLGQAGAWVGLALSCVSLVVGGSVFAKRAWASLRGLWENDGVGVSGLSMDVPIVVGILAGWLYSAASVILGTGDVWLDSVCVLIAALLTARYVHIRGHRRAREAVGRGVEVLPDIAHRVLEDGSSQEVDVSALAVGDHVLVRSGDIVPADGVVVTGTSRVNRAMLTGESDPERVAQGDAIEAGALNEGGALCIRVEAAGDASRMGAVAKWVTERNEERARVYAGVGADAWGGVFVLAVLVLAVAVCAFWWVVAGPSVGIDRAVALLVVACPCALSMAAPLAFSVTVGQAAERGIYIKESAVLEHLRDVTAVVLDKTGTLTQGALSVEKILGNRDAFALGCALEEHSQHPIARALVRWFRDQTRARHTLGETHEVAGCGVTGEVNGQRVWVGRMDWVAEESGQQPAFEALRANATHDHLSWVAVAVGGDQPQIALAGLSDALRPESPAMVESLRARGLHVYMFSGDARGSVARVAQVLGISERDARAEMTPEEKEQAVRELQSNGAKVLMLGDGINDAAALQQADIGCAVGESASISQVAADIFVIRGGLQPVLDWMDAAARTQLRTRLCLALGLAYNVAAVFCAAMGWMSPLVAAFAMPISSLAVVLTAITLRAFPSRPRSSASGEQLASRIQPISVTASS